VWREREEETVISSTLHVPSSGATIRLASGPSSGPAAQRAQRLLRHLLRDGSLAAHSLLAALISLPRLHCLT
jgi:hypothetical protein